MEQLELLSKLPLPAVLMFGVTLAIIFYTRHFGLRAGENSLRQGKPASAEVAAVIVDPTALNNATRALEAHTTEMMNGRKSFERGAEKICFAIEGLSREVDGMKEEMIRRKR